MSFKQYKYCSLCKLNHNLGKKHIYSKRHQDVLNNILQKFERKIGHAKSTLFIPDVRDAGFESGAKFWCYFCGVEVSKHFLLENCVVLGSGLLHHIASDEHRAGMEQFFWDNLLKKKRKAKFILTFADLTIFEKASFLAVKKYQKAKTEEIKQLAATLSACEQRRCQQLSESMQAEQGTNTVNQSVCLPAGSQSARDLSQSASQKPKHTIKAYAEGIACVSQGVSSRDGNVHSGAPPPWLQAEADDCRKEIGPTAEDFAKHLDQKKKAKLPTGRVGAKFDHTDSVSHDWLPSFGRVWSKGRRLQSKQHFEKEWKKGRGTFNKKHSTTVTSTDTERSDGQLPNDVLQPASTSSRDSSARGSIVSYKRKSDSAAKHTSNTDRSVTESRSNQMLPSRTYSSSTANQNMGYTNVSDINGPKRSALRSHVVTETRMESVSTSNPSTNFTAVPYKRQRTKDISNQASVNLIQTPILSLDLHTDK